MKTVGVNFKIGAGLSSGFSQAFVAASKSAKGLGAEIKGLEKVKATADKFAHLKRGLGATELQMRAAQTEAARLGAELKATAKPTKKLQQEFARAQDRAHQLKEKLAAERQQLQSLRGGLAAAGVSTRNLSKDTDHLTKSIERAKKAQADFASIAKKQQANMARRDEYQGRMMGAAATVAAFAAPMVQSAQIQESEIRLSTVINAQDQGLAMAQAKEQAKAIARSGLASYADAYNAQYALNSAGLSADASRSASMVVAKVAKVTAGVPETVGEVIATTYNNLGNSLTGTTEQKMARIGDLLTKVQFKFQIRDFGQLGESLKEGAAGMANYNVPLGQGVTLLGQLNSAGLQGGRAGTALNAVLRNLGKAQKEWGTEIVRNQKGELDMIATMDGIKKSLDETFGDDLDGRAQAIQKIFGDEGARGFVPLINKLGELKAAEKDVIDGSQGLTDREVKKFTESPIGQFNKLKGSLTVAADGFARVLLPGANAAMSGLAAVANVAAFGAEKFPTLTKVVIFAAAGLAGLHVAGIAAGYASTFVVGGWLKAKQVLAATRTVMAMVRTGSVGLAVAQRSGAIATGVMTTAQWALNTAMVANPIGLVVAGAAALASVALVIYQNWQPISAFFGGVWAGIKDGIGPVLEAFKPFAPVFSLIGSAVSSVGGFFTDLITPIQYSADALSKATSMGVTFGNVVGTAIRSVFLPLELAAKGIGWVGKKMGLLTGAPAPASAPAPGQASRPMKIARAATAAAVMATAPVMAPHQVMAAPQVVPQVKQLGPSIASFRPAAGQSGAVSVTQHITINIPGGASPQVRGQVDQAMVVSEARLKQMIEKILSGDKRLRYAD